MLFKGATISDLLGVDATDWGSQSSNRHIEKLRVYLHTMQVEVFWLVCIFLNTVNMIVEEQYEGGRVGHSLGVYSEMGSDRNLSLEGTLKAMEAMFALMFTIETALWLIVLKWHFFYVRMRVLDLFVVAFTDVGIILEEFVPVPVNVQVLRLLRLTKVFRLLRLLKRAEQMEAIMIMAAALRRCVDSASWAIIILFGCLSVFALLITSIVRDRYLSEDSSLNHDQKVQAFKYFGSYARSMLSMFELALANWTPISRFLTENVHEWWMIFLVLYKLTIGFAMIGILNSVFMQETFQATELDNDIMVAKKRRADAAHRKKMMDLFDLADRDHDGTIGRQEFGKMLLEPAIRTWLMSMNLDISDANLLFDLIDDGSDPNGMIDKEELIAGIARLRGPARSIDVKALRKQLEAA